VIKDAKMLGLDDSANRRTKKGVADVWTKDCFGLETREDKIDEATATQRYREALLNPPLLVGLRFDRFHHPQEISMARLCPREFTNDHIDRPENFASSALVLRIPDFLSRSLTTAKSPTPGLSKLPKCQIAAKPAKLWNGRRTRAARK